MLLIRPLKINDVVLTNSNVTESDYPPYAAGITFNLNQFCIVVGVDTHDVYQSLVASNVGNNPATSPTKWALVSKTNRWKMFDGSVSSQTKRTDSIDITLTVAGSVVDSIALLNISAASVQVIQKTSDGVTYNKTKSLVSTAGITDMYSYLTEPIVRMTDLVLTDLPPYANSTIRIILSDAGADVLCGACVVGQKRDIGGTQYGANAGIQDYSIKQKNAYGDYSILQRAFAKRADFTIQVESGMVDQVQALLAQYRAQPIVYVGSDLYSATIIYGFYKDFSITISYPTMSICSMQIEGLT